MFVKNNIAQPGEIKSVFLYPTYIDVKKQSGEVLHYERKAQEERVRLVDPPREGDN